MELISSIEFEATVVGIVCSVFLVLFVVAGIVQAVKQKE